MPKEGKAAKSASEKKIGLKSPALPKEASFMSLAELGTRL